MPKRPQLRFPRPFDPANLRSLIEKFHNGNVTDAARYLGLTQSTLHNLLQPGSAPMAETLEHIASRYSVTMDFTYGREGAKALDDRFSSGVLHAITTMQHTLETLNSTRDLAHLSPDVHASARYQLGTQVPPGAPSSITREAAGVRDRAPAAPSSKFPVAERDPRLPASKKRGGKPGKKRAQG
jgi:transcriptional regulator with XRE-family HTH domain